ncbi:heavy metal-binding domain-containing protein [Acetilactobacillus jinshanensis]|uniref:Heavy metal-binding domain-containing protein n=1 Tax=Acetilactobacillus jinshanensis TaxID=1720083 RepID=A0A4P6ZJV7_9LACO|nr:heavy metal-binding domain-containing protein [Acetilactobacillus jinshanensis]QBP18031.1 heavy metal-binding domain-containing protein [Acetilactobacillus jinshanensis]URL60894.1 heavy metal-binding domain-containing protein [uncultured bacterium]
MKVLNNNLPKQAYKILGHVKGAKSGKLSDAYRIAKNEMMQQAKDMHADALLGVRYSQTPTDKNQCATVTTSGVAIKITNQKYVDELFKGVC